MGVHISKRYSYHRYKSFLLFQAAFLQTLPVGVVTKVTLFWHFEIPNVKVFFKKD